MRKDEDDGEEGGQEETRKSLLAPTPIPMACILGIAAVVHSATHTHALSNNGNEMKFNTL